jgi:ABC-type uncharacterized transport system auxiliary subunit
VLVVLVVVSCGEAPATRYYGLVAPARAADAPGTATLDIEPLTADRPYDDDRIVYRVDPFRVDYYEYHRWSASPGTLVANYLIQALDHTGRFRTVVHAPSDAVAMTLGGHVVALEEVDATPARWVGHVALELELVDRATGRQVWSRRYDETEPMPVRSPEGLARAVTTALGRITRSAAPTIARIAEARASGAGPCGP